MSISRRSILPGVLAALVLLALAPAMASAAFVGPSVGGGNTASCNHTNYAKIQEAIEHESSGGTITICAGEYKEQLAINKSLTITGKGDPTVELPASPEKSTTTCDTKIATATGLEDQDLVSVCGAVTVSLTKVKLVGKWTGPANCARNLNDILVAGGGTVNANKVEIEGAGASPINGCQQGIAIEVGVGYNIDEVGHASLEKVKISGYQKNGITVDGVGSTATITGDTITGAGPAPIGQNGIQVSRGATATITSVLISGNDCQIVGVCGQNTPSNSEWGEDATAILFFEPGASSTVSDSKLNENQIGIANIGSESASEVTISSNKITGGLGSIQLGEGSKTTLGENKLTGAYVGLDFIYYNYGVSTKAPAATGAGNKITGDTHAAIQVESSLYGFTGSATLTGGHIQGPVNNYDPDFSLTY